MCVLCAALMMHILYVFINCLQGNFNIAFLTVPVFLSHVNIGPNNVFDF